MTTNYNMNIQYDSHFFSNTKSKNKRNDLSKNKRYTDEDLTTYKPQIYKLCKQIMNKKLDNNILNNIFDDFIFHSIEHIKFKEKVKSMQRQYSTMLNDKKKEIKQPDKQQVESSNTLLYKDKSIKKVSIDKFIKKNNNNEKKIIPRQLDTVMDISYNNLNTYK